MIIPTLRVVAEKQYYQGMIESFYNNNISTLRVNMTRHNMELYQEHIAYINGLRKNYKLDIMADIPIPGKKCRLLLPSECERMVYKGNEYIFTLKNCEKYKHCDRYLPVEIESFGQISPFSKKIIIGDGEVDFLINSISTEQIVATACGDSTIRGKRAFIVPGSLVYQAYDDEFLMNFINAMRLICPRSIVLSFSEDVKQLVYLRNVFNSELGYKLDIIPKIETSPGIKNLDAIMVEFPNIMLGRGDLALSDKIENFTDNHEAALRCINPGKKKNVIVATDILSSLYGNRIPSRADLIDIFHLHEKSVKDIVASAGISIAPDLFDLFCYYANCFM